MKSQHFATEGQRRCVHPLSVMRSQAHLKMVVLMDADNLCFYLWDLCRGPVVGSWAKLKAWFVWKGVWAFLCQSPKSRGKWVIEPHARSDTRCLLPLHACVLLTRPLPLTFLAFASLSQFREKGKRPSALTLLPPTPGTYLLPSLQEWPLHYPLDLSISQLPTSLWCCSESHSCVAHWKQAHSQLPGRWPAHPLFSLVNPD